MARPRVLTCPACDAEMPAALVDDVEVDFCDEHGIWLDGGELELLAHGTVIEIRHRHEPAQKLFCPRCDRELVSAHAARIDVEACPVGHGVWLDHGDVAQLNLLKMEA